MGFPQKWAPRRKAMRHCASRDRECPSSCDDPPEPHCELLQTRDEQLRLHGLCSSAACSGRMG